MANKLDFAIGEDRLAMLLTKIRLSAEPFSVGVKLFGDQILFTSSCGEVRSQASTPIEIKEEFQVSRPPLHLEVESQLFTRLLLNRAARRLKGPPIRFCFPEQDLFGGKEVIDATIWVETMHIDWPFRKVPPSEILPAADSSNSFAKPLNTRVLSECIQRCRPYSVKSARALFNSIEFADGRVSGGQKSAARWIEAPELSSHRFSLDRAAATYLSHAIRHFSATAKIYLTDERLLILDETAILSCPTTPLRGFRGAPQDAPPSIRVKTSALMSALSKVIAQRKASETRVRFKFRSFPTPGMMSVSTQVVGGEAIATCEAEFLADGKFDGAQMVVQMDLPVEHLKPLGANPGGMVTLHFPGTGILFVEQHNRLTISTHLAAYAA